MESLQQRIEEACRAVRTRFHAVPKIGIILGTGLGGLASQIDQATVIPYGEIPHFPESTVESHTGQLVCGR